MYTCRSWRLSSTIRATFLIGTVMPTRFLVQCLLLLGLAATGARGAILSPCQGHFDAVRGPAYSFEVTEGAGLLSPDLSRSLELGARAIYDHWAELLAAEPPFVVQVRLALLDDAELFARRKAQFAAELPDVTGFYSGSLQTAVVLLQPQDPVESRRRALHEMSHLVTVTQAGAAPYWLAEGLAEFHETITFTGDRVYATLNDRHLQALAADQLPSLAAVLGAPPSTWQKGDSQAYYSVAWSLVYFLMSSAQGRGALGLTLQQSSTHSCGPYRASSFLGNAWPGGIGSLERQWQAWLAAGDLAPRLRLSADRD